MIDRLWLGDIIQSGNQLVLRFGADDYQFQTTYWYDFDLTPLGRRFGTDAMRRIYFHILAFEANKLGSLSPRRLDLGQWEDVWTPALSAVWYEVFHHVWAQWRYENGKPDYAGPAVSFRPEPAPATPIRRLLEKPSLLAFCGGGKDSLVGARLLERLKVPYGSLAYSSSIYGTALKQHQLIEKLQEHLRPEQKHRQWIYDDFMDSPILQLDRTIDAATLTAAETPSSLFGALPLALAEGYNLFALAHERSANRGNLVWDLTGEDVNHQWGKSLEAEVLLGDYIRSELVADLEYFSLLQPIYDVVIFHDLMRHKDAVPSTHSCNVEMPWCNRCPKCAYVWLNYRAYLPSDLVRGMFPVDLLEIPANQLHFRQMLGLEEHTPFECIGQIPEAQLALHLIALRGELGPAGRDLHHRVGHQDWGAIIDRYASADGALGRIPSFLKSGIREELGKMASEARTYLRSTTS